MLHCVDTGSRGAKIDREGDMNKHFLLSSSCDVTYRWSVWTTLQDSLLTVTNRVTTVSYECVQHCLNVHCCQCICSSPVWNDCILTALHYYKVSHDKPVNGHIFRPHAVSLSYPLLAVFLLVFIVLDFSRCGCFGIQRVGVWVCCLL